MNYIAFKWEESTSLVDELTKPLKEVSIEFDSFGSPMAMALWRFDGTGLSLNSEMHDVAEKREIGVLSFATFNAITPLNNEVFANVPSVFNAQIKAYKLIIRESGTSAESGIVLQSGNTDLIIVPSASPYAIAISGLSVSMPHIFEPEYQMDHYERVPFV